MIYLNDIGNYLTSNIYGGLRIKINIIKDDLFEIENHNILSNIFVNLSTAILGGNIEYRSFIGIEELYIPPKTQDGDTIKYQKQVIKYIFKINLFETNEIKLKSIIKGIKYLDEMNNEKIGDHIIKIKIIYPKKFNEELKKIIKKINI